MLEERLSSAYSQQTLGYAAPPGAPQYPSMPSQVSDVRPGAENFYYGNPSDIGRPPTTVYAAAQVNDRGYEASTSGLTSPVYPSQTQRGPPASDSHNNAWNPSPYPSLGSPPPSQNVVPSHVASGLGGPTQYHAPQPDQDPTKQQYPEAPYHPSPAMRRDSQYQTSAPLSATEPQSPGNVQSPVYSTVPPTGSAQYQQPSGPPPQSYYYQPQQPTTAPATYPQMTTGQPGPYPEASQSQPLAAHQPARPVEESLIEL